jgi:hypothetical protein
MATEKVLIEVNLSTAQSVKNAADLKRGIMETQKEIAALTKATEGNTGAQKAAAGTFAKLEAQLKTQKKEYSDNIREIQNLDKITKATASGSIEQMRAALSVLTKQYNGLSQAERENTKDGYALQKQIKGLSDKLKEQEGVVGDTRRNVGNYAEAFSKLPGPLGKASSAASGFNTTLKANPILLVVSLLVSFAQQLGKNAAVADQVTAVFEGLNKAFQFIIDTVVDVVFNFDNLTEAITHPIDFLKKLGGGLIDAGKSGYEGSRMLDAFTTSAGKLNNEITKNESEIAKLENKLLNISLSFEQRKQIAEDLANLEIDNAKKRAAIADEELKVNQEILKGKTLNNEEEQKLADLAAAAEEARAQEAIAIEEKNTRIAKLARKEDLADAKADRDAAKKTEEEKLIEHRQKLIEIGDKFADEEAKKFQSEQTKKQEAIKAAEEKRLADAQDAFNQEIGLIAQRGELETAQAQNEIQDAEALGKKKNEITLSVLTAQLAAMRTFAESSGVMTEEQFLQLALLEAKIKAIQQAAATPTETTFGDSIGVTPEQTNDILQALNEVQSGLNMVQDIINAGYQQQLNQIDGVKNAQIEQVKNSTLSEKEKTKKIAEINKKAALEKYEIEKKAFETNKTFQIINTIISGALAIVQSFAQLGPIAGAIGAVLTGAVTAAQVSVISSSQPPPPPFKEGGFTEAGNPNEVATNLGPKDYTYHKSEYVTPAHVLATPEGQFHVGELEKMRQAKRSGRKYLGGMADGGFAVRGATSSNATQQAMIAGVVSAVQNMPAPVVRVTDINRVNKSVTDVRVSSELR